MMDWIVTVLAVTTDTTQMDWIMTILAVAIPVLVATAGISYGFYVEKQRQQKRMEQSIRELEEKTNESSQTQESKE